MPVTLWRKRKRTGSPKSTAMKLTLQLCFTGFSERSGLSPRAASGYLYCLGLASPLKKLF